jgi:hypothetical protein
MNTFYYHSGEVHTAMSSFCFPSTHKKENNKINKRKLNGLGKKERNKWKKTKCHLKSLKSFHSEKGRKIRGRKK